MAKRTNAARATFKHAEKMARIKKGDTFRGAINKVIDNARDRNVVTGNIKGNKMKASGMGAIKQAGKTVRRAITSKYSAETSQEKYRQQTAQRESDNRAKVQQAALSKWNGIINMVPETQQVLQDAPNVPALKDSPNTTGTPTPSLGGY